MLNRLFIVIGILAILAISGAFIVPRFIQWGDYRGRMEAIASEVLGAEVEIAGDIGFTLLPQPVMRLNDVVIGPDDAPSVRIASVEAEFSLVDFLRDHYRITRLVLDRPQVAIRVDAEGRIDTEITLPGRISSSNIWAQSARITNGLIQVLDSRSGDSLLVDAITGDMRLDALRGPFGFQGTGVYEGAGVTARVQTSALDPDGAAQLSVFLRPDDGHFSLTADGILTTGLTPGFIGQASLRQPPPRSTDGGEAGDVGAGDLVVSGRVEVSPDKVLMPDLTILPDANRPATRLTGLAEMTLGEGRRFNALIEGASMVLPPRDATAETGILPYELVRQLSEIPRIPLPPLPGTVRVDIGEVNLRALSLRQVRFDATTDGRRWDVSDFTANLPGNARLAVAGLVYRDRNDNTAFDGIASVEAQRLDGLAALWRGVAPGASLLAVPGRIAGSLLIEDQSLRFADATFRLDGVEHAVAAEIGFGPSRYLTLSAAFSPMTAAQSAALGALLPDVSADARFAYSFPRGSFALNAEAMEVYGVAGRGLAAQGVWEGGVLEFETLSAEDFGGIRANLALTAFGTLARPEFSGQGTLVVLSPDAGAIARIHDALGTPPGLRARLSPALPLDVALELSPPDGEGGQVLTVAGRAGASDVDLEARLSQGIARVLSAPMDARLALSSGRADDLAAQLGLGALALGAADDGAQVIATAKGALDQRLATSILIEAGEDLLGFSGEVQFADPSRPRGAGSLELHLDDAGSLLGQFGAGGIALPRVEATATMAFDGDRALALNDIVMGAPEAEIARGTLSYAREPAGRGSITGAFTTPSLTAEAVLGALTGPASLVAGGEGVWPEGPIALGTSARSTTGRIRVSADALLLASQPLMQSVDFDFDWDATNIRLRGLSGEMGGGEAELDVTVCCAGPFEQKQITGRTSFDGVALDAILPPVLAEAMDGRADFSMRFDATGASLRDMARAMSGEGTYAIADLRVEGFDPAAFADIAALDGILDEDPATLAQTIEARAADGALVVSEARGGFTIAGGVVRSPNLSLATPEVRIFGSGAIRLDDLGIEGTYTMTPAAPIGEEGLITETTGRIQAVLSGTLANPSRRIDAGGMVDAIMVRALEVEVERLERLRAEDEARAAAAQAEQASQQAETEEAARLAREAEAARIAEEARRAEAARLDLLRRSLNPAQPPQDIGLGARPN
ncbi:AsmA-like C-terminal region [Devosia enhydra]|uniref:AsmA-like C-terminal region n=1 Tax=Devosia enhydra TaxID=665118 RepID=A0A1K2HVY7_9HYPH|nr:AsmA family protein [Devosia enhydra]SFZ82822.1 AsmA-like C-terminal region [Devosia enhydra]